MRENKGTLADDIFNAAERRMEARQISWKYLRLERMCQFDAVAVNLFELRPLALLVSETVGRTAGTGLN
jgi:hypothetical protein